jgi:hypothetical protein
MNMTVRAVEAETARPRKKEKKNPLQKGLLKGIGSSVGMQSYKGGVGIKSRRYF